jgi:iron complex transport system substrate-binding protein
MLSVLLLVASAVSGPPGRPERIVSLSPSATEILYAVGAFDRVVAVSRYCEYPEEVKKLPRVGGWTDTNLEQVLGLAPDLVVLTDAQAPFLEGRLQSLGIRTLAVGSQSLEDIFGAVLAIGVAVGKEVEAKELSARMRAELQAIADATAGRPRPSVLVVVDRLPGTLRDLYVATGKSYLTSLVEIAGGDPILPEAKHNYTALGTEALLTLNPEVVFDMVQALIAPVPVPGAASLAEDPAAVWKTISIRAVENDRVYALTDKRLVHPSQFAIHAAREMAKRLHPDAVIP